MMKERDYINLTNVSKLEAALIILGSTIESKDFQKIELSDAYNSLIDARDRLREKTTIDPE